MGLPLLLLPELICRVLICRVPNGGWSRSLHAPSAPRQRLLQPAKRECRTRRNRALPEFAACSRGQAGARLFLYLRESPENARAISAAPGSSATSRPNCAANVRPDETRRGRSSRSATLLLPSELPASERHNADKYWLVRGGLAVLPGSVQPASAGRCVPESLKPPTAVPERIVRPASGWDGSRAWHLGKKYGPD